MAALDADAARTRALLRVIVATTIVVAAFAMLNPVLAVRLSERGVDSVAIGAFLMLPFAAVGLMMPLMPRLLARYGVARAYQVGLALETAATFGYASSDHYALWCVLALLGGAGAAALWNGTEALIAHNAAPARRGRWMGIYQTVLGLAMAVGPFVPGMLPWTAQALVWLACAMLVLALLITVSPAVHALRAHREGADHGRLGAALARVPHLAGVALAGGVFEAGLSSITTVYGAQSGLSLAAATTIAGVIGLGSAVLQYPCGWLADHLRPSLVFRAAGAALLVASLVFCAAPQWPATLWLSGFVWGAVGGALYTLTMIRVAHVFADSPAGGSATMILAYTTGGVIGPPLSGWVLQSWGAPGQGLWLAALAAMVIKLAGSVR